MEAVDLIMSCLCRLCTFPSSLHYLAEQRLFMPLPVKTVSHITYTVLEGT